MTIAPPRPPRRPSPEDTIDAEYVEVFDEGFEEDPYPRRRLSKLRAWFRSHRRWLASLPLPLRVCAIIGWLFVPPLALLSGAFYGVIWRAIMGY